jgi:hypothetical protein
VESGEIVRLGAVDLITYSDEMQLRLLTPYPAIWDAQKTGQFARATQQAPPDGPLH